MAHRVDHTPELSRLVHDMQHAEGGQRSILLDRMHDILEQANILNDRKCGVRVVYDVELVDVGALLAWAESKKEDEPEIGGEKERFTRPADGEQLRPQLADYLMSRMCEGRSVPSQGWESVSTIVVRARRAS